MFSFLAYALNDQVRILYLDRLRGDRRILHGYGYTASARHFNKCSRENVEFIAYSSRGYGGDRTAKPLTIHSDSDRNRSNCSAGRNRNVCPEGDLIPCPALTARTAKSDISSTLTMKNVASARYWRFGKDHVLTSGHLLYKYVRKFSHFINPFAQNGRLPCRYAINIGYGPNNFR